LIGVIGAYVSQDVLANQPEEEEEEEGEDGRRKGYEEEEIDA